MVRPLLGDVQERGTVLERLTAAGLGASAAEAKADLLVGSGEALLADGLGAGAEVHAFWVPGRIEVLGKHTDYAGGRSLLAATERGFCFAAVPRSDQTLRLVDAVSGERTSFEIDPELVPEPGHWSNYPMTVARRLARNFSGPLLGADVAFASDLPQAAGMSSSSAMIVGFSFVLAGINRLAEVDAYRENIEGPEALAGYLGTIENGQSFGSLVGDKGVGTFGGSEDHTAMLCCRLGRLSQYAYCPVRFERRIDLPTGYTFIGSSLFGVGKRQKASVKVSGISSYSQAGVVSWQPFGDRMLSTTKPARGVLRERYRSVSDGIGPDTPLVCGSE